MDALPPPELSVLIASHNRRELLRRCLESLRAQTAAPSSFEAIVADDGSTDGTAEMVAGFAAPFELRLLRLEQGGKYTAVNTALGVAAGQVCLILDDDVVASPELVAAHLAAHRSEPTTLGIGALTQRPPAKRDWYARAFAQGLNEHYAALGARHPAWSDCYGANLSAPLAVLREIDGFTTDLTNAADLELGFRLEQAGCVPRYLADAHGTHDDQKSWRGMFKDARRRAPAHLRLAERHPAAAQELLDWRSGAGPRELRLRRLLIALRFPLRPLLLFGALLPGEGRKMIWFHFLRRLAFWRAVRRHVDRRRWAQLTRPGR